LGKLGKFAKRGKLSKLIDGEGKIENYEFARDDKKLIFKNYQINVFESLNSKHLKKFKLKNHPSTS
jgi:hypothetical protein